MYVNNKYRILTIVYHSAMQVLSVVTFCFGQIKKNLELREYRFVEIDSSTGNHSSSPSSSPTSKSRHDEKLDLQVDVRLVMIDMLNMRLASGRLGYKSRMIFVLPDCLRLKSEVSTWCIFT